jgi:hypothetical protein
VSDVLYSIAFLSIVRGCASEPADVHHIGDYFKTLIGSDNDEQQQDANRSDEKEVNEGAKRNGNNNSKDDDNPPSSPYQYQEGFYFFSQDPQSDSERKRLRCYRLLWSLVMHVQESPVKQVCRLLFQSRPLAAFVFRFIDAFMRRIALGPHVESTTTTTPTYVTSISPNATESKNASSIDNLSSHEQPSSAASPSARSSGQPSTDSTRHVEQHVSLMHNVLMVFTLLPRNTVEEARRILSAVVTHFLGFPTPSGTMELFFYFLFAFDFFFYFFQLLISSNLSDV